MMATALLLIPFELMMTDWSQDAVAPVITIVLSLTIYSVFPHMVTLIGMVLAIVATFFMAMEKETSDIPSESKRAVSV